jgi:ATP-binding cassette, subfamily B, bacterial
MRGMGPERSIGGMARPMGLHRQATRGFDQAPVEITWAMVRRIGAYFRPYWLQWTIILLCIGGTSGLGVLPPLCVRAVLDKAIPGKDATLLHLMVAAIVGLTIVSGFISVLQDWLSARAGQSIVLDLRDQLYQHLQSQSLGFYTRTRTGEIISRVNNDVGAVQGVVTGTFVSIAGNLLNIVATLVVIFSMSPSLALLTVVIVPAFYLPTRFVGRVRANLSLRTQECQAALLAFLEERLQLGGVILAKMTGRERSDAAEFHERNSQVRDLMVRQSMAGRWLFMCLSTISVAGPAMIYWYGGHLAIRGQLTVGTIIAFVAYLANLYRPTAQLANVYVDIRGAMAVFDRIFEYLDMVPEVRDTPTSRHMGSTEGHICLENVSFGYPSRRAPQAPADAGEAEAPKERRALEGVSFAIEPGQRVALVGPSGAGKTTITYLIPRLYDPTEGRIMLDGLDLRDIRQEDLRAHIGMVTQDTFLHHATVRENLQYARPGATDDEIVRACQAANIHEFVSSMNEGYDTVVGERGFRLSGGERQRLAIARALLKDPRILVLDEATSNLDATSEYLIQQALDTLLRGRTAVVIAHRLSTILTADKIVVLQEGRKVEEGTHPELLALDGLYATLYRQQFARVIEEHGDGSRPAEPAD